MKMCRTVLLSVLVAILMQIYVCSGQTASDVRVTFTPVREGGVVMATFTLQVAPPSGGSFMVTVTSNTPVIEVNEELTFTPSELEMSIGNIMVSVDRIISGFQVISNALTLMGGDGSMAQAGQLILNEGTVLTANFVEQSYTFAEGDNGEVCVGIDGTLEGNNALTVVLQLDFDGTASDADASIPAPQVEFDASTENMVVCVSTNPAKDSQFEMPETFSVRIVSVSEPTQLMIGSQNVTTVTLLDLEANCGEPPAGTDVNITVGGPAINSMAGSLVANSGATATYVCSNPMQLFPMGTTSVLTCMSNGSTAFWSPAEAPVCELGNCGPLPMSNASVTLGGQTRMENGVLVAYRGAMATYSCPMDNCMLNGEERLSCVFVNNTAVWYPSAAPYCVCEDMDTTTPAAAILCEMLSGIANGDVEHQPGELMVGSMATYSCETGFQLVGIPTRTCMRNSQWSGVEPMCAGAPGVMNGKSLVTVFSVLFLSLLATSLL